MEFDEIVVKDSPGLCRCCLSEGCYKDLGSEYVWMSETEVYADMLLDCFDISISQHNEGPNGPNRLICEVCITRLRDACNFKKQVLDSEKKFVDMVGKGEFSKTVVTYQDPMKTELPVQRDITDVEYLDEDLDFEDDNFNEPTETEATVEEDITVSMLPIKTKRGRPKKSVVKPEKVKMPKLEEKPRTSKVAKERFGEVEATKQRKEDITRLVTLIIKYSTIIPFRWSGGRYLCFYCCCCFSESSKLIKHTTEEHEGAKLSTIFKNMSNITLKRFKLDVTTVYCRICWQTITDLNNFLDHISDTHSIKFNRSVSDCLMCFKLSDNEFHCLDCEKSFRFFGPLLIHVHKQHVKTKKYLCEVCGADFVAKLNLDSHVKTVHSLLSSNTRKEKLFKCTKCTQIFRNRYLRSKHLALDHDIKSAQYKCEECSMMFIFKGRLVKHQLSVHVKERYFECHICGFKVFSKDLLKRHMVKHDDTRPFECDYCKKTFQRKKTLDMHKRIHTNDRRYACSLCGKAFVQVSSLKVHLRVHHPSEKT